VTGPRLRGVVVVSRKASITYRGSAYEQSWKTCFFAAVARLLRCDPHWLLQSTPSATPSTTRRKNLRNRRRHQCYR